MTYKFKFLIAYIFLFSVSTALFSQKILQSANGFKITLSKDGSWEFSQNIIEKEEIPLNDDHKEFLRQRNELREQILDQDAQNAVDSYLVGEQIKTLEKMLYGNEIKVLAGSISNKEILDSIKFLNTRQRIIELRQKEITKLYTQLSGLTLDPYVFRQLEFIKNSITAISSNHIKKKATNTGGIKNEINYSFDVVPDDVIENPPDKGCEILFEGFDENTGKDRRDVASQTFFSFTHPELRGYFKEKDYINCEVQFSKLGEYNFLTLHIVIHSKKAKQSYGYIEKGTPLTLTMINGENIYLRSVKTSVGIIDGERDLTKYEVSFVMDNKHIKDFSKREVDRVGILWSNGYEEYDVYEVDALMHQAKCLGKD